ncbi:hypothetical protein RPB_4275 [Rhodopseudomonas palustris HaA2]|uniref:Uncharacterized protein n=1 Tax=Rhodopseudomonas palustris (strain HaA2) TaxID=316058 RepID=Q2IS47_RHOP2|nr:hypothetical protein [Rhodopseudomonas palustris]ABD08963.1 hypothetical protein RPB_4275 [Rhodopseudomonas palustris HaA2]
MTELSRTAQNEVTKLTASFVSNLGVGLIAAGVFAPALSLLSERPLLAKSDVLIVGCGCVVLSGILHLLARSALRSLQ